MEDTELVEGLVLEQRVAHQAGGVSRTEKAKIGLIQFCISPPKTDVSTASTSEHPYTEVILSSSPSLPQRAQMDNQVVVNDYAQMDRILKEERQYILNICKAIKKAGCNVLLIQKSILRDAVNDLALHFLAKMKIMVVRDVERDDVEFICRVCGWGQWVE